MGVFQKLVMLPTIWKVENAWLCRAGDATYIWRGGYAACLWRGGDAYLWKGGDANYSWRAVVAAYLWRDGEAMMPTFEELVMLPFFGSDSARSLIVVVNVSCHQQKKILWGFINCMAVTNLQYKTRCTLRKHGLKFCNTAISQTCQMHLY